MFANFKNAIDNALDGLDKADPLKAIDAVGGGAKEKLLAEFETELLNPGEKVVYSCKSFKHITLFTEKRIIDIDLNFAKRRDYTSISYSKISAFTVEDKEALEFEHYKIAKFYLSGRNEPLEVKLSHSIPIKEVFKLLSQYID